MADVYEKDLAQKTSLTTSDYIRVVGSDNVSYKQLIRDVANTILTAQPIGSYTGSIKDWAFGTNGQGITATSTSTTDLPSTVSNTYGVAWVKSLVLGNNHWINLYWSPTNSADVYICANSANTTTWSEWQKMPTRGEVDALGQKFSITTSGQTFTIASGYRGILYITDSSTPRCGEYFVISTGAGAVSYKEVSSASDLTITVGTNSLTLTPTIGSRVVMFTTLQGTVS